MKPDACLNEPIVVRLKLGAYPDMPIVLAITPSMSRSKHGAVRKISPYELSFVPLHALESSSAVVYRPNFSAVTLPNLLKNDSSGVMMTLPQTVYVLGRVLTELWRMRPHNLLYSDSSVTVSAIARPESIIV
ncbi:hypothetical protein Acr_12g0009970 [Actinidia rufa]|uniref:Uncharacterized protein n=1 Tax=Actinidia rufa TaxID=165716 RepID=A0A7J0FJ43_9ERIC|nr:hypothetical protein Acr_12g0009970 [Actinidia rufa]